jgi:hypothetical protein
MAGWVNGNDYERSSETFGILPVLEDARRKLSMLPYHSEHAATMKIHHADLAKLQGTRSAVLPVHTNEEKALYQMLIQTKDGHFTGLSPPNWITLARQWSDHSDGIHIFYKVRTCLAGISNVDLMPLSHFAASRTSERLP